MAQLNTKIKQGNNCRSVERAMEIIGKRWAVLIVRLLSSGTKRFCELEHSLQISPRVLSKRLSELEKAKIITRKVSTKAPIRVDYSLTDKGKDLIKVIESIAAWGHKYKN